MTSSTGGKISKKGPEDVRLCSKYMKRGELRVPDTRHAKQLEPFGDNTPLSTTLAHTGLLALHWPTLSS